MPAEPIKQITPAEARRRMAPFRKVCVTRGNGNRVVMIQAIDTCVIAPLTDVFDADYRRYRVGRLSLRTWWLRHGCDGVTYL